MGLFTYLATDQKQEQYGCVSGCMVLLLLAADAGPESCGWPHSSSEQDAWVILSGSRCSVMASLSSQVPLCICEEVRAVSKGILRHAWSRKHHAVQVARRHMPIGWEVLSCCKFKEKPKQPQLQKLMYSIVAIHRTAVRLLETMHRLHT
jgi:hypothetical protein